MPYCLTVEAGGFKSNSEYLYLYLYLSLSLLGYENWISQSSAQSSASAVIKEDDYSFDNNNNGNNYNDDYASRQNVEVEVPADVIQSVVKKEKIAKAGPVKIVPKGRKTSIVGKSDLVGQNEQAAQAISSGSGVESQSVENYSSERIEERIGENESYYEGEEEYEGGHMDEDDGDN